MFDFHNSEGSQAAIGLAYAGAQEGSSSPVQLGHPAGLGLVGVHLFQMTPDRQAARVGGDSKQNAGGACQLAFIGDRTVELFGVQSSLGCCIGGFGHLCASSELLSRVYLINNKLPAAPENSLLRCLRYSSPSSSQTHPRKQLGPVGKIDLLRESGKLSYCFAQTLSVGSGTMSLASFQTTRALCRSVST